MTGPTPPVQLDLFDGAIAPVGPAKPRPAGADADGRAEYVQITPGVWAMCVYRLIPKIGFSHLHFPHYWGGPQGKSRWRVDRHGADVPDGTFIFTSRAEAEGVIAEAFGDATDLCPYMGWIEIPSDDHRPKAAGRRTPRRQPPR